MYQAPRSKSATSPFSAAILAMVSLALFNHSIITYTLTGTPLVAWKQLIGAVALLYSMLRLAPTSNAPIRRQPYTLAISILIFSSIYLTHAVLHETNLPGYGYNIVSFGFLLLPPTILRNTKRDKIERLIKILTISAAFVSIGIIIDYYTNAFAFIKSGETDTNLTFGHRPSFLLGSSTLSFCVLSLPIALHATFHNKPTIPLITLTTLSFLAILLSGSRMSLALFSTYLIFLTIKNKKFFIIALLFTTLGTALYYYQSDIGESIQTDRLMMIASIDDPGNFHRAQHWIWLYQNLPDQLSLFGKGVGFLRSTENNYGTTHFESSLISIIVEGGIIGLIMLYLVIVPLAIFNAKHTYLQIWISLAIGHTLFIPGIFNYTISLTVGIAIAIGSLQSKFQTKNREQNSP